MVSQIFEIESHDSNFCVYFCQFLSPARLQDLTFTAHLLVLTDLGFTFFLKLFFPTYLLTQANKTPNHPLGDGDCPDKDLSLAQSTQTIWAKPLTQPRADGLWSDPWNDQQLCLPHYYTKISVKEGDSTSFT